MGVKEEMAELKTLLLTMMQEHAEVRHEIALEQTNLMQTMCDCLEEMAGNP